MNKRRLRFYYLLQAAVLFTGIFLMQTMVSHAQTVYTNPDTGYRAVIEEDAGLLSQEQCQALADSLTEMTAYGNVAFKTIGENDGNTEDYAESYYRSQFGTDSGTLFLIDMGNRNLYIFSDGAVYQTITKAYANTITDNVYRYASQGNYYQCASEAFGQMLALLQGQKIAQPMKYICNGLLALILALLLHFCLVSSFARLKEPGKKDILRNAQKQFSYTKPTAVFTHKTRTYHPIDTDSSSGSSGGGSSSSGGGGGHSF